MSQDAQQIYEDCDALIALQTSYINLLMMEVYMINESIKCSKT